MALPDRMLSRMASVVSRYGLVPPLQISRVDIRVANLPHACDGFRIAHLSDLHVGDGDWGPAHLEQIADILRRNPPDVLVNTGDFLQGNPPTDTVLAAVEVLHASVPGRPHLAVLGNHDYYAGEVAVQQLVCRLGDLGVQVLTNRTVSVGDGAEKITFAGLTEESGDFEAGVAALESAPRPTVLLTHHTEMVEQLPFGASDLVLCGHTHGGQIALGPLTPFIVRRFNGSKYIEGRYTVNGSLVYINRGLGNTGVPIRFRAQPELTMIHLQR